MAIGSRSLVAAAKPSPTADQLPVDTASGEACDDPTAGGGATSAPGLSSKLWNSLRGRPAAGAITHGHARRQHTREAASVAMAEAALADLTADQACAVVAMHLRGRTDLAPATLHRFANAMSRHADTLERRDT